MPKTWILVADRSRARLFAAEVDRTLRELENRVDPEGRARNRELVSDRASRMPEMPGRPRGALEAAAPDRHAAEQFARSLAQTLEHGRTQHACERVVLVAPPEFLGLLRIAIGEHAAAMIVAEIGKNLTERSPEEIRDCLPDHLWSNLPQ